MLKLMHRLNKIFTIINKYFYILPILSIFTNIKDNKMFQTINNIIKLLIIINIILGVSVILYFTDFSSSLNTTYSIYVDLLEPYIEIIRNLWNMPLPLGVHHPYVEGLLGLFVGTLGTILLSNKPRSQLNSLLTKFLKIIAYSVPIAEKCAQNVSTPKPVLLNTTTTPIRALKITNSFLSLIKIFHMVVLPYQNDNSPMNFLTIGILLP